MNISLFTWLGICLPLVASCSSDVYLDVSDSTISISMKAEEERLSGKSDSYFVSDDIKERILYRARQMSDIKWTPQGDIPAPGGYYSAGKEVFGIPYSSVKEKEKYVGQYVSFYTFFTAVLNPKSVLYTENVREYPYHGTNCSTYYGTVCSMAVNYVLGIPYSYTTSDYKKLDDFYRAKYQSIENVEIGDILLQEGKHVVIIVDLKKTQSSIDSVFVLESSASRGTRIDKYSFSEFRNYWRMGWEIYRYSNLNSLSSITEMSFNEFPYDTPFNSPVCSSRGDRAVYRKGEDVVLNNLDGMPHKMSILCEGEVIDTFESDNDMIIKDLQPGLYTFDHNITSLTNPSIEVIDTNVSLESQGRKLKVLFSSSNAKPLSIIVSDIVGVRKLIIPLSEFDRERGFSVLSSPSNSENLYVKVMFEGLYGCISNKPILIP